MLVNCAGVGVGVPISDLPHDEWDRIIGTNLTGVFNCCKAAIPHLKHAAADGSSISRAWRPPTRSLAAPPTALRKPALNAFSDALMQELRYDNIRVTLILPGSVATGIFRPRARQRRAIGSSMPRMSRRRLPICSLTRRAACPAASRYDRRDRSDPEGHADRVTEVLEAPRRATSVRPATARQRPIGMVWPSSVSWPPNRFQPAVNAIRSRISFDPDRRMRVQACFALRVAGCEVWVTCR